ncbi:hypothetical protein BaRGS_00020165 [Batillaria attramentaria]|uniref:Uncharacterized protein n=1 Tax=Batillaria attramentaria TaxID=370345 RepID=A0ABD0KNR8_9CAEN
MGAAVRVPGYGQAFTGISEPITPVCVRKRHKGRVHRVVSDTSQVTVDVEVGVNTMNSRPRKTKNVYDGAGAA